MTGVHPGEPGNRGQAVLSARPSGPAAHGEPGPGVGAERQPRILYVAGLPRSGSTVLGCLLGGLPGAIFVGELAFFWRRFADSERCSCGQPLPSCPFWSVVAGKAFGELTREQVAGLSSRERAVFQRQWPLALLPLRWPARKSQRIGAMLAERARLYRAIGEVANATCVVDSGKELIYGSLAARIGGAGFSTVHIVRDPRGVAYSWQKNVRSDSAPRDMPRRPAMRTAVHWVEQNLLVQLSLRRLSSRYARIRYEDLATRPADVLDAIADATQAVTGRGPAASGTALAEGEHHWVSSNPGVRKRLGKGLRLTLDEEWRAGMPRRQRRLVTIACGVLMAAYGYPLRSRGYPGDQ